MLQRFPWVGFTYTQHDMTRIPPCRWCPIVSQQFKHQLLLMRKRWNCTGPRRHAHEAVCLQTVTLTDTISQTLQPHCCNIRTPVIHTTMPDSSSTHCTSVTRTWSRVSANSRLDWYIQQNVAATLPQYSRTYDTYYNARFFNYTRSMPRTINSSRLPDFLNADDLCIITWKHATYVLLTAK